MKSNAVLAASGLAICGVLGFPQRLSAGHGGPGLTKEQAEILSHMRGMTKFCG